MAIGNKWAGKLYGTNTGNLYATLESDSKLILIDFKLLR